MRTLSLRNSKLIKRAAIPTVFLLVALAASQTPLSNTLDLSHLRHDQGAGHWRDLPVDPAAEADAADPSLRNLRNAYWSRRLPSAKWALNPGSTLGVGAEVPTSPGVDAVVATFTGYTIIRVPDSDAAYTEMHFRVDDLLRPASSDPTSRGQSFDVDEPGGTYISDGVTHRYGLEARPYPCEPGHRYILLLVYIPRGEFFEIQRKWDITSGIAVPGDATSIARYRSGDARVSGLSAAEAIRSVRSSMSSDR